MSELELASTESLIDEIKRRHTSAVIILLRPDEKDPKIECFGVDWGGGLTTCIGMVSRAKSQLTEQVLMDQRAEQQREEL